MADIALCKKPRLFCIGTHHKTGTVWMRKVFVAISRATGVPWFPLHGQKALRSVPQTGRAILWNWHSNFPGDVLSRPDVRMIHLIRDPRDVLISGMKYHLHAPIEGEQFLHRPRADLGGKTYQAHLNALPDDVSRLRFEMHEKHAETLAEMCAWDYQQSEHFELTYEALMQDKECRLFGAALEHLGFYEDEIAKGCKAFYDNSLFGGLARKEKHTGRLKTHIRSGKVAQWRNDLPLNVAESYLEYFGDELIELGYEKDRNWLSQITSNAA